MLVPDFVKRHLTRRRCHRCHRNISDAVKCVAMAGLELSPLSQGIRFEVRLRCPQCRGSTTIVIPPPIDWEDVGAWIRIVTLASKTSRRPTALPDGEMVSGINEEAKPLMLKPVVVLDATPGRAGAPDSDEKIAILTLGYMNEVQPPLMIPSRDCWMLAKSMLAILAHHGDEKAREMFSQCNETE